MTTATSNMVSSRDSQPMAAPTLLSLVSVLFGLTLREKLNAEMTADQTDGAMHWGM